MRARLLFCTLLVLLLPASTQALNSEQFRPNFDGLGLVNLLQSRTLEKRSWSVGMGLGYSQNPLELGVVGTGERVGSVIDYYVNAVLHGGFGLTDWVTLGMTVPFFPTLRVTPIGSTDVQSSAAFGDLGLAAKFRLWNRGDPMEDNISMGLAVSPLLTFPTGSGGRFTGESSVTGSLLAVYDLDLWKNKVVANVGFRFREKETFENLAVGQELLYRLGFTRAIYEPWDLSGLTELGGSTTFNGFGSRENRTPLEWLLGLRKGFLSRRLTATVGSSLGLTKGFGTPDFRVFTMLTYQAPPISPAAEKRITYTKYANVEGGQIVILQPIHFETARWVIQERSLPVVRAVADLMIGQPHIRRVSIEGHTDWRGTDAYNRNLSDKRANAVREKLVEYGVEPERLAAAGRGELQPIAENRTGVGMSKNRRVEFHILEVQRVERMKEVTEKKVEIIKR